jgi:hypothetical protein
MRLGVHGAGKVFPVGNLTDPEFRLGATTARLIEKSKEGSERLVSQFGFLVAMQGGVSRSRAGRPRMADSKTADSVVVSGVQRLKLMGCKGQRTCTLLNNA